MVCSHILELNLGIKARKKGFMPDKQGIKEMGSKLFYFLPSLIETVWSQMEKCAFPDTK